MYVVDGLFAREILDSRGNPTVEVDIHIKSHDNQKKAARASACVPSGASTGSKEAVELRDNDKYRFNGKGVLTAVKNVNTIIKQDVIGKSFATQETFDANLILIDGTANKSYLGANSILGCSLAFAKAKAILHDLPLYKSFGGDKKSLPRPMMNIINGGRHADNGLDIQEFMIIPKLQVNYIDTIRIGVEIFHKLKRILSSKGFNTNIGDEGGFAPHIVSTEQALDLILAAIEGAGYKAGEEVNIALDAAASEFYKDGLYHFQYERITSSEMISFYSKLVNNYPIISIEDPLSEYDGNNWSIMTAQLGNKIQIVGDDIFVTNPTILQNGIKNSQANSILIKLNQIGTLSETLAVIKMAQEHGWSTVISHRSGETEDVTIAHLAVATNSGQIKTGSLCRTDRVAKYNELIRIAEKL